MAEATTDLTDQQIEKLLLEAETRLTARGQNGTAQPSSTALIKTPKQDLVEITSARELAAATTTERTAPKEVAKELSLRKPVPRGPKKDENTRADAGPGWFNLPRTNLTPELKKDLQLLRMRDVLDPKRHYKKDNSRASVPEFSQIGTIIEGPTEYFTARMTKKERKRTLLEEVLEAEGSSKRFKHKYGEIQAARTSGKKAHYKKMMANRYGRKG